MSFGAKTKGLFSFDDAAKQASSAGKWRDHVFKLSGTANNWDDLWDAAGEKSFIELLLCGVNNGKLSRVLTVGKDRNVDFPYISSALAEIATWTGGDVPSATNPVAIFVKPGEYDDFFTISLPFVHIFGLGNQAESVIIKSNAQDIITVNQPTTPGVFGFNILKGLELYQYGADVHTNIAFAVPTTSAFTVLMCRECFFKRDVAGATTVNFQAMFHIPAGLFFGEDIRVEQNIIAGDATAYDPHMFFVGDGGLTAVMLRDAKIDYFSEDPSDLNSLILTHPDFTGEIDVENSEINMVGRATSGTPAAEFYLLRGSAAVESYFRHNNISMYDEGTIPSNFVVYKMSNVAASVISAFNDIVFAPARGGSGKVFSGVGSGTTFDFIRGGDCAMGSLDLLSGVYCLNGSSFYHGLSGMAPDITNEPNDFWSYWFDNYTGDLWGQARMSGDLLVHDHKLSYEDWAHLPVASPLDATYPTYRLYIPVSTYTLESYCFQPGRPLYCMDGGGNKCHGIVIAAASAGGGTHWQVDIAGYIPQVAEGYDETSWRYGDFSRVVTEQFTIHGDFSDSADDDLLKNVAKQFFIWEKGQARIVRISHRVVSKDTGANQPRVNVSVDGNKVCTSNASAGREVNTAWVHTVDDIDGPVNGGNNYNKLSFGSAVEITVDANGSNKDAMDLTVIITAVLE
jgi:hypothetical protein